MRQMGAAALLPLAVAVACLAALAYGEALALAIVGARVTSMTASDQAEVGLSQMLLWFVPAFIAVLFVIVQIVGPRSLRLTVLGLGVWFALAVLHQVALPVVLVPWTEVGAVVLVAALLYGRRDLFRKQDRLEGVRDEPGPRAVPGGSTSPDGSAAPPFAE
jgi:hypothetical protein